MISFACAHCGMEFFTVRSHLAGQALHCVRCEQLVLVPLPESATNGLPWLPGEPSQDPSAVN